MTYTSLVPPQRNCRRSLKWKKNMNLPTLGHRFTIYLRHGAADHSFEMLLLDPEGRKTTYLLHLPPQGQTTKYIFSLAQRWKPPQRALNPRPKCISPWPWATAKHLRDLYCSCITEMLCSQRLRRLFHDVQSKQHFCQPNEPWQAIDFRLSENINITIVEVDHKWQSLKPRLRGEFII